MNKSILEKSGEILSFLLIGILLSVIKFQYHELWKDEWQVWMLARDQTWSELLTNLYFEGHPALWYLYIKIWTFFSSSLDLAYQSVILQVAHLILVVIFLWIYFIKLKLPIWLKLSFLLGYFFIFEYSIVNRGYILVLLIGSLIVHQLHKFSDKNAFLIGVLLFLLCQVEVFSVLMAGSFVVYLFVHEYLKNKKILGLLSEKRFKPILLGAIGGLVVFLVTVFPRTTSRNLQAAYTSPFSSEALGKSFQGNFVNTYLIGLLPDTNVFGVTAIGILVSVVLLAVMIYFFLPSKKVLYTYLFFSFSYFLFCAGIFPGGVRQWGMIYVFFFFSFYLMYQEVSFQNKFRWAVLSFIFIVQFRYLSKAFIREINHPFTNAKEAGIFIREKVPERVPVLAINKFETTPVIGYAARNFYSLPEGEEFSFFKWTERVYLPPEQEFNLFAKYKNVGGLVIISPKPLQASRYPNLKEWKIFNNYSIKGENYFIYTYETPSQ